MTEDQTPCTPFIIRETCECTVNGKVYPSERKYIDGKMVYEITIEYVIPIDKTAII